jgi:ORF6N domain
MSAPSVPPLGEDALFLVRKHPVILDSDLAALYGVEIRALNQALKRNADRFPEDFAFRLTAEEWESLRSQSVILKTGRGRHRKFAPWVFTEHGALQAANILNSPRATAMSVYLIRAFVKMREERAANEAVFKRLAEIDKTLLLHDKALRDVYQKLLPLLQPPPTPPRKEIGFHVREGNVTYKAKSRKTKA